ncbi:HAD family phosphatase [Candidatus Saccharibacteria bacterium]|nr:HAD family phosphatase [Candidatus Saccharibacteria bacterium]
MGNVTISHFTAAIFDMDGTMIQNMAYHTRAWRDFVNRYDIDITDGNLWKAISGKKNTAILASLFSRELTAREVTAYSEEKEAIYRELYREHIEEVEGLSVFIDTLHKLGLRTAIATTSPKKNYTFVLNSLGLMEKFEVILGDEDVKHGKPNPEIYKKTAAALGVSPSDCIAFEDSPPGVQSAKRAGMTVVGIVTSHAPDELQGADYTVANFTELM